MNTYTRVYDTVADLQEVLGVGLVVLFQHTDGLIDEALGRFLVVQVRVTADLLTDVHVEVVRLDL